MEQETKRRPGRPAAGRQYPVEMHAYGELKDLTRVDWLAERWRCSRSAAIRRAIEETAEREGLRV